MFVTNIRGQSVKIYEASEINQMISMNQQFWQEEIKSYQEEINKLKQENEELKSTAGQEKYRQYLDKRLTFSISDDNWDKIEEWKSEHLNKQHGYGFKNQNTGFEYSFYRTAIGTFVRCHCLKCRDKLTIPDYENFSKQLDAFCEVEEL